MKSPSLHILRPNLASLGYALFLAINATGVWGGIFPFLPLEFQTPEIILRFFLAQSLVFFLSYFASALGAYFFPGPTRRFLVVLATIIYFIGWCCLISALYINAMAHTLVILGGGFLGLGSAGFFMLWQRLFASQDPEIGNRDLILGTAYASLFYFSLYLIPSAVTVFLIPLVFLPLFALCIILSSRTINFDQPMFEDIPRKHPFVYRQVIKDYWRIVLSIGALAFCCGIMRALVVKEPETGLLLNITSMTGALIAALSLLFLWQSKNIRINTIAAYRFFFPFLISAFLILPFIGESISLSLASIFYAMYSCSIMLMMIHCAQASRDQGINPVFIYGFCGGIVYFLHDVGYISGTFVESIPLMGLSPLSAIALIAIYLLGLMYFTGQGGFRQFLEKQRTISESIELIALNAPSQNTAGRLITDTDSASISKPLPRIAESKPGKNEPQYRDRISKQCAALKQHYRLSAREAEVMELIVRGNSVVRIAEELIVSENTIRTHTKRIYTKLAIHKKQELLDLIEEFSPEDIQA